MIGPSQDSVILSSLVPADPNNSRKDSLQPSPSLCLSTRGIEPLSPPGQTQGIQPQTVVAAEVAPEKLINNRDKTAIDAKETEMEITDVLPTAVKDQQVRGRAAITRRIRDPIPLRPLSVGGCLSPYWKIWQREGASPWTVEVLRVGYRLPFVEEPPSA